MTHPRQAGEPDGPAASPAAFRPRTNSGRRARQLAARREQFIVAAEKLFLEHGFAKTSVNAIVREAGGSLATLYSEFGTKEALFESVLSQRVMRLFPQERSHPSTRCDAESELRLLATHMLKRMLSEDGLAVYRLVIHEAPRFPGLRKAFLEAGIRNLREHTATYLGELAATHELRNDDCAVAAAQFISLVQGSVVLTAACGGTTDARMRADHVQQAVQAFLKLYPVEPS